MSQVATAVDFKVVEGNKSPTLNGTGYVFFTISPVAESFLKNSCESGKRVLDIGAGFNDIPLIALKNEVAEYVATDISPEHLAILKERAQQSIPERYHNHLTLIPGKSPQILNEIDGKFDAILADKVIHFFAPEEILDFMKWARNKLNRGGKLYITVAAPYSKRFSTLLPEYEKRKTENIQFPGYFRDVMDRLEESGFAKTNYPEYVVPNSMVFFDRTELVKLATDNGFKVVQSYSLSIPTAEKPQWSSVPDNQSSLVGIIAQKK